MHFEIGSDKVISKLVDDEAVIINLDTGIYYNLEGVSAVIWTALSTQVELEDIRTALTTHFPAQDDISAQLDALVAQLQEQSLVKVAQGTPSDLISSMTWPTDFTPIEMTSFDDISNMVALDPPLPELS